jgi:hypothetical protein
MLKQLMGLKNMTVQNLLLAFKIIGFILWICIFLFIAFFLFLLWEEFNE